MFRIRKDVPATCWMLPEVQWYHGKVTFTSVEASAAQLTEEQCTDYLALPSMHAGAFQEPIPE